MKGRVGQVGRVGFVGAGVFVAVAAQAPNPNAPSNFVTIQAPVVVLTHARVIDDTGAPARADQTIIIRDGNIADVGAASSVAAPAGATIVDLTGKSVIPGLVMMHEHLYYTTGPGVYGQLGVSFSRLYLAGGVTTMRTGGNVNGIMDINLSRRIAAGELPGPSIDATAPYIGTLNGATFMGRDARIGSIARGKQADLVVVAGDPSTTIADVRRVETVFKNGVGYDSAALIDSVRGQVGVW